MTTATHEDGKAPRNADGASPAMAQWFACKAEQPDALLFFRMGDFYELFFEDAQAAAPALGLTLTRRGTHEGVPIPLCGVPAHAADGYLLRLIRRGFRVAVAEQTDDSRNRVGKAPIPRAIVRLVTPGTLTEDALLEAGAANRLVAIAQLGTALGAASLDLSTGLFETEAFDLAGLHALLGRLDPAEVLAPRALDLGPWTARRAPDLAAAPPLAARARVAETFGVASLEALGPFSDAEAMAACLALDYARAAGAGKLPVLQPPVPAGTGGRLEMDAATRASLEVSRARDGGTEHTLLAAIRRTLTAPGARLLAERLEAPSTDLLVLRARQEAWVALIADPDAHRALRAALRGAADMPRALARLSLGRGGPRDLLALAQGMAAATAAHTALPDPLPPAFADIVVGLRGDPALGALLAMALADPAPVRADAGCIAAGHDAELDADRLLATDSRQAIAALQAEYARRYGVPQLKIRLHAQLGYLIEVPAPAVEAMRAHPELVLRQGMASGARFGCAELVELDRRIAEAADRAAARERTLFAALCARAVEAAPALAACAASLARLDVAQSAATLAGSGHWCRPELADDAAYKVERGRHPVVEAALLAAGGATRFVANDCDLSAGRQLMLLTGPNMAGKSTFLRQNALAVLLAQAGLPVPALTARLGVVDRLFCRIGAGDDLARGQSTFMAEMTEAAAILHRAGPRSMVVVDEIGRGTATLDGLAIAWAVLEALHGLRARTIFATHFHELSQLGGELPHLCAHTMRVKDYRGEVVFLHEVAAGSAGRSWGVHVAKLAGVPAPVVRRAGAILAALEVRAGRLTDAAALPLFAHAQVETPPEPVADPVYDALRDVEPDTLTPRDALALLYRLRAVVMPERTP